jgi:pimeloyl-ACP methyl ester carboxylesterase
MTKHGGYDVDGHWLEAQRIEGRDPNLPTIVMLHEGLGSVAHWKDFPSRPAEETGAGVFLYSRYGHLGSDALTGPRAVSWMHHEAQIVLPEILRKAGIERPILLGHSDGASIAIFSGGMFPGVPAALIAIKRRIPSASAIILEDCGHAPHRDRREATLSATSRFLVNFVGK